MTKHLSRRKLLKGLGAGTVIAGFPAILTFPQTAYAGPVDVFDFGAIANNSTDCYPAFNNALDAVLQRGLGEVYIPAGLYRINSTLEIPSGAKDIGIRGEKGAYLMFPTLDDTAIKLGRRDYADGEIENISLTNFRMHGPSATDPKTANSIAIEIGNCRNVVLRDMHIQSFSGRGIVGDKPSTGPHLKRWEHVTFDRVSVAYTGLESVKIGGAGAVDALDAFSCYFNNGGKRITNDNGSAGVFLRAIDLTAIGGQVSGMRNDDDESGYISGMLISAAMAGKLEGYHFELNGNDQTYPNFSRDLFLEDCAGYTVDGLGFSCADTRSAQIGVFCQSKVNIGSLRAVGGPNHTLRYLLAHPNLQGDNVPVYDLERLSAKPFTGNTTGLGVDKVWSYGETY